MDNKIEKLYKELGNVWKVGDAIGWTGQRVHIYLTKKGLIKKMNIFSESDKEILLQKYIEYRDSGRLSDLAKELNRTKNFICRKAKELGLTSIKYNTSKSHLENIIKSSKDRWKVREHPKGMLGKNHSEETKLKMSKNGGSQWKDKKHIVNSKEYRQKMSDVATITMDKRLRTSPEKQYTRSKSGTFIIGGKKHFYRSEWEVNIAAYFEFLKKNKEIIDWEYEPHTFWFLKIKRGVRSYRPDFRITRKNGSQYYVEVKGWMDDKSKTKLKRMGIYYPEIEIDIIEKKRYNEISKNKSIITDWGILSRGGEEEHSKCSVIDCNNKEYKNSLCRKHNKNILK